MKLIFNKFHARMQCFVAFLAGVSLFERHLGQRYSLAYSPTTYKTILAAAHGTPANIVVKKRGEKRLLDEYFLPAGSPNRAELTDRNQEVVTPKIIEFLKDFVKRQFLGEHSPIGQVLANHVGDASEHALALTINGLTKTDSLSEIIERVRPEKRGREASVQPFIDGTLGTVELAHPDFPSLGLLDIRALKVEFHGLDLNDKPLEKEWGIYAIVREPRGWSAEEPDIVNLLVRDILWISPRLHGKDEPRGFYASAFDGAAFVIDHLRAEDETVIVQGVLEAGSAARHYTQRTRIVFSRFQRLTGLHASHGMVAGTAGDGQSPAFAAWKALIIRPTWSDMDKLQGILFQLGHTSHTANVDATTAFALLRDAHASGVLFSRKLKDRYGDVSHIAARKEAFRTLIASDRNLVISESEIFSDFFSERLAAQFATTLTALRNAVREHKGEAAADEAFRDANAIAHQVMMRLGNYIRSIWHLLEPAQLITFKSSDQSKRLSQPEFIDQLLAMITKEAIGGLDDIRSTTAPTSSRA